MGNSALLEGFDDPAVMAAVQEIAQRPETLPKHAGNEKVSTMHSSPMPAAPPQPANWKARSR
jgi:hypothetical protein